MLDPVTLDALDDVRRRQLEIASRLYSGNAESAEAILGRGEEDDGDERIHPRFVELRTIVDLGCDLVQGYVLARPSKSFAEPAWPEDRLSAAPDADPTTER